MSARSLQHSILLPFLAAIEAKDAAALSALLADDVIQIEHPNLFSPAGRTYDKTQMLAALARGAQALSCERYELLSTIERGSSLVAQLSWTGTLAVPALGKQPGELLRALIAIFIDLDERALISRVVHYDCYLP